MINVETFLKVTDNSGAVDVKCLKVYGQGKNNVGKLGSMLVISVRTCIPKEQQVNKINRKRKILKKSIQKAVCIRIKKKTNRYTGEWVSFGDNAVVLIKEDGTLLCTRVFGPVSIELRSKKFMRIISLSSGVF